MIVGGLVVVVLSALQGDHEQAGEYLAFMTIILMTCWPRL